jgi:hypothetical protein
MILAYGMVFCKVAKDYTGVLILFLPIPGATIKTHIYECVNLRIQKD